MRIVYCQKNIRICYGENMIQALKSDVEVTLLKCNSSHRSDDKHLRTSQSNTKLIKRNRFRGAR